MLRSLLFTVVLLSCTLALAAPKSVSISYQIFREQKLIGTINETYQQQGNQYKITSVTEGVGLMALAGKRVLTSEGIVSAEGLQPLRFESRQGDNDRKTVVAEFDWSKSEMTLRAKGNVTVQSINKGTLDLASYPYQWMFTPPVDEEISVWLTTGKKAREYRYQMIEQDVILMLGNQSYQALTLSNAAYRDNKEEKLISLSRQHAHLPVRILLKDDSGMVTEQVVNQIRIEY
jgi:hypothetical protein